MAITVQAVIEECRERFPDLRTDRALSYLNDAHNELLRDCRILIDEDTFSLSTTRTYTLDADILKVWEVRYVDTSSNETPLSAVSIREKDKFDSSWRSSGSGTPVEFYIDRNSTGAAVIGFNPVPDGTGSIAMSVSRGATLTAASSLPECIDTPRYYIYAIWERYSESREPSAVEYFRSKRLDEKSKLSKSLTTFNAEVMPRLIPSWYQSGGRA